MSTPTAEPPSTRRRLRDCLPRLDRTERWLLLMMLLAYGWLFVYFPKLNNPNEQARLYTIRAIVEDGTPAIGRRQWSATRGWLDTGRLHEEWGFVNDKALVCDNPNQRPPNCEGTLTANKAPGLSLLGVPIYAAQRAVWRTLGIHDQAGRASRTEIVFTLRWTLVILPTLLTWLALRRHLRRRLDEPLLADGVVLAGAFGSLSLTYGQLFAGHQPCALALAWAWMCIDRGDGPVRDREALGAGLFASLAVALEYPALPATLVLLVWFTLRRPGWRAIGFALCGGAIPAVAVMAYHAACYGAPWITPYAHMENPIFMAERGDDVFGLSTPTWERIAGSLWSPFCGLWFYAPWTALFWLGLPLALRRQPGDTAAFGCTRRAATLAGAGVVLCYTLFQLSQGMWRGGWVVGPRYMTPLVPALAIVLAMTADRLPANLRASFVGLLAGLAGAGIVVTGICSSVSQGFPIEFWNPLREVALPLLGRGYIARNPLMWAGVPGPWSGLPYFAALAVAGIWAMRVAWRVGGTRRVVAGGCAGIALVCALAWTFSEEAPSGRQKEIAFEHLRLDWAPPHPPGAE